MYNALNGLGGGGLLDTKTGDDANTAVYSTFAVIGFLAGTFVNRLGVRNALAFGGIGYVVYVSSYLCYKFTANLGYVVFAGALLGVCAGILWSAQGVIMLSYPPERFKGRYIAYFWVIFNLGGVIGALVSCTQAVRSTVFLTQATTDPTRPEYPRESEHLGQQWHLHCFLDFDIHRCLSGSDSCPR